MSPCSAIDRLLLEMAVPLIDAPAERIDELITHTLGLVREATGDTAALLVRLSEDPEVGELSHWSVEPSFADEVERLGRDFSWTGSALASSALEALDREGVLYEPDPDQSPAETALRRTTFHPLRSLFFAPLQPEEKLIGVLILGVRRCNRAWPESDQRSLRQVASMLSRALQRKRRDEQLRKQTDRLVRAERIAKIGTWELDIPANRMSWSNEVFRIFGMNEDDPPLEGTSAFRYTHPADDELVREAGRAALKEGRDYDVEHRIIRDDGQERWLRAQGTVSLDEQGRPAKLLAVTHDITDRKQAEIEREHLRTSESHRMESLGRLAGGIAHDFNNLLMTIVGNGELALSKVPAQSPVAADLEELLTACERAKVLVARLLSFSRTKLNHKTQPLDLTPIVSETLGLLRSTISDQIELETSFPDAPVVVKADPTEMHQIVMNLCTNALYAMPDRGRLELAMECQEGARAEADGEGSTVRLTVKDTGEGMDPDTRSRAFEPYFTTKIGGRGTGLGLPLVRSIVERTGGTVRLESQPGEGCVVEVELPLSERQPRTELSTHREETQGAGLVLFVDDEPEIRRMMERTLQGLGYSAVTRASAAEALDYLESSASEVSLVLTDNLMPGKTGIELAAELNRRCPQLPVVLITGAYDQEVVSSVERADLTEVLAKPIGRAELSEALARVIVSRTL